MIPNIPLTLLGAEIMTFYFYNRLLLCPLRTIFDDPFPKIFLWFILQEKLHASYRSKKQVHLAFFMLTAHTNTQITSIDTVTTREDNEKEKTHSPHPYLGVYREHKHIPLADDLEKKEKC